MQTQTAADRRDLQFTSFDDVRRDVDALIAADAAGMLRRHGNWTLGQALGHLAAWVNFAYDGYPMKPLPWLLRWMTPMLKRSYIDRGKSRKPGVRIPGVKEGTYAIDVIPAEQGRDALSQALARLEASPPTQTNPVFGRLTYDEWKRLHLHHCSLHLGFFSAD